MIIYVGNISDATAEVELRVAFEQFGKVVRVRLRSDDNNGSSQRFSLIEMPNVFEARHAVDGWNGQKLDGRVLLVNEAPAELVE